MNLTRLVLALKKKGITTCRVRQNVAPYGEFGVFFELIWLQINGTPEAMLQQPNHLQETCGNDYITAGQELGKQQPLFVNCVLTGSDVLPGAAVWPLTLHLSETAAVSRQDSASLEQATSPRRRGSQRISWPLVKVHVSWMYERRSRGTNLI